MTEKSFNTVESIRERDVIPILANALNYGPPTDTLYAAAIEEITELRRKVLELGGTLPTIVNLDGKIDQLVLNFKRSK